MSNASQTQVISVNIAAKQAVTKTLAKREAITMVNKKSPKKAAPKKDAAHSDDSCNSFDIDFGTGDKGGQKSGVGDEIFPDTYSELMSSFIDTSKQPE
jgi:hypothetical protein